MRYFLEVAYRGTKYHGWQIQQNAHSVQEELERALFLILRTKIPTFASGRTDTGVHGEQQFVQLDLDFFLTEEHILRLNKLLPKDISIRDFYEVSETATARFDAISRTYEYRISTVKNPFNTGLVYFFPRPLDIVAMNEAAASLKEFTDFESFSKVHTDVNTFKCTVHQAYWSSDKDLLVFTIEANRFLRGMVRAITGTLMEVGLGRLNLNNFKKIILEKNRRVAGQSVPPDGLFLTKVKYPREIFIGEMPS